MLLQRGPVDPGQQRSAVLARAQEKLSIRTHALPRHGEKWNRTRLVDIAFDFYDEKTKRLLDHDLEHTLHAQAPFGTSKMHIRSLQSTSNLLQHRRQYTNPVSKHVRRSRHPTRVLFLCAPAVKIQIGVTNSTAPCNACTSLLCLAQCPLKCPNARDARAAAYAHVGTSSLLRTAGSSICCACMRHQKYLLQTVQSPTMYLLLASGLTTWPTCSRS